MLTEDMVSTELTNYELSYFAGIRRVGRRPDQQGQPGVQHQGGQGEGRPGDKRQDRRPPRERRFEKPAEEKPEGGGEFSVDKWVAVLNDMLGHLSVFGVIGVSRYNLSSFNLNVTTQASVA